MKTYWEIPGPSKSPHQQMIAFDKLDGSNLRFEWQKKRGWIKFGTRKRMFDATDPEYGQAIQLFLDTYAEGIEKVIKDNKTYRGIQEVIAFCEFFGPSSFAGWHDIFDKTVTVPEPKEVVLFDINLHKKGFVLPRDFVNDFGHLKIPKVIYEGNFGKQFVEDVITGKYPVTCEGVVCKGVIQGKKSNGQHGLWMCKVKTEKWMKMLRDHALQNDYFKRTLSDNDKEQVLC